MMLFINGISRGIQITNLAYWVKDYESAFEMLTQLVAEHWTLQEAMIVDGYDRMSVPVEVFDGQPIQVHIQTLQQQWQQLLSNPPVPATSLNKQQLIDWCNRLDAYYEDQLVHLQKLVVLLEIRLVKRTPVRNDYLKRRINQQQDQLLEITQRMYKQTKLNHQKNRRRLSKLKNE